MWARLREDGPSAPGWTAPTSTRPRLSRRGYADVTAGDTLVHTDVRDDNVILGRDGRTWICDWNWPVIGAAWLDTLFVLIAPRGDGHDADALLASLPLTRDVPGESDRRRARPGHRLLPAPGAAAVAADLAPPAPHQQWQGEVCWDWLCERRGWSPPGSS